MVAVTKSENLNPWLWRKQGAAKHKDTAPLAIQSENSFESRDCPQTDYVMVPATSVDQLKDYVPIDRLTAQKILEQAPAVQGNLNIQDRGTAKENRSPVLAPLPKTAELVAPEASKCAQSTGATLAPLCAPDQLEGYEPTYFLKEDGKDDEGE